MDGQPRCVVIWNADPTETPIKIHLQGLDFNIPPNTETEVPVNVLEVCVQSSFDVQLISVIHPDGATLEGDDARDAATAHHKIEPVVAESVFVEPVKADVAPVAEPQAQAEPAAPPPSVAAPKTAQRSPKAKA